MQKDKTNRVAKQILRKNKTGTIILPDFKASCQTKAINISRWLWGDGHADENEQRKALTNMASQLWERCKDKPRGLWDLLAVLE